MKKTLLFVALFAALSLCAQDYQWQWAKRGGGVRLSPNETGTAYNFDSEQILDIAVDSQNNYYYLAFITERSTEFENIPVTVYNSIPQVSGSTDILLISTDCEGTFRWVQTIGGGSTDYAYNIQLDNNGGLYIGANIINLSNFGPEYLPPHFSPDDAQPLLGDDTGLPQEGYKTTALLKYNTNDGSLAWRVMPQGDVTPLFRYASINQVVVDSDGTLHTLMGFAGGTHLNGAITVPSNFTNILKYYIVTYNANGEYLGNTPLDLEGYLLLNNTEFRYDESLDRYYIAGYRTNGDIFMLSPLTLNGTELADQAYIMAFNSSGANIWVKEITSPVQFKDSRIYDLKVDSDSSLYLSGKYYINSTLGGVSFGDYAFPTTVEGNVPYVLKLNPQGAVQWMTTPSGYTTEIYTGSHHNHALVINGDEVGVATQATNEIWGNVSVNLPANHMSDPGLLRLNKTTGTAIGFHLINGAFGYNDALTAVTTDNDGNYVAGGYFYYQLFTNGDDNIPTLNKVLGDVSGTDFFITKLAAGPCGIPAAIEHVAYNEARVYPNPTSGVINVQSETALHSYQVLNMLGQVLLQGNLYGTQNAISVENFSAGTYIINIKTNDKVVITRKIIKE
ncbi:T9SS type A sorting domain-containing protein [Flavobacterium psychrotrophum]|uniref:T9SS type A sorting domain-containing protein n=1 Tax=Flavobacterium psychrotrophum TaxID=2294119 RepID=UPI000E31973B|nr:T9SS type A sorting domain-containing protein [Flavobacterium psychrotrophum]